MIEHAVAELYVGCAYPLRSALAASDTCRRHATSAVRIPAAPDPDVWSYRCDTRRGLIRGLQQGETSYTVPRWR